MLSLSDALEFAKINIFGIGINHTSVLGIWFAWTLSVLTLIFVIAMRDRGPKPTLAHCPAQQRNLSLFMSVSLQNLILVVFFSFWRRRVSERETRSEVERRAACNGKR